MLPKTPHITVEELAKILSCDPETGEFTWIVRPANVPEGRRPARTKPTTRRRVVTLNNHQYLASRVAFALYHGRWPEDLIDHVDGNPLNDRKDNLREATHQQNMWNKEAYNEIGLKGVGKDHRQGGYYAQITHNKQHYYLGRYKTAEEAAAAFRGVTLFLRKEWIRGGADE